MIDTLARPGSQVENLQRMVRAREALGPAYAQVWPRICRAGGARLEEFAATSLELAQVNAGPACIGAFWRNCATLPDAQLPLVLRDGREAAEICRLAGARAALSCLEALPAAIRLTKADPASLAGWWRGLHRLAQQAPAQLSGMTGRVERLLAGGDGFAFADFVAAGLKATVRDKARREAFFALEDALAQALLLRHGGQAGFADSERMLGAFIAGLWGGAPRLKAAPSGARRGMIASGTALLPPVFAGVPPDQGRALYRAAAAHAHAHLTAPQVLHPVGQLKPLQIVLIGLIEDARVEALAIRRLPGLRRLWAEFHTAQPGTPHTASGLLARLSRALLDPGYADADGFVEKARALFSEHADRLEDPQLSRAIGGRLGNDLGQMRLQFNAKTYVIEPPYRDDNLHLWALPDAPDDAMSMTIDTARGRDDDAGQQDAPGQGAPAPRARDAGLDDRGTLLATYPEWDSAAGVERADWTSLRDTWPILRTPTSEEDPGLRLRVSRLVRSVVVGPSVRQSRQEDGEELDIDAAIDAAIARRSSSHPDTRLYRDRRPRGRDLATLVILDTSQSTAAIDASGHSVLAAQVIAVRALAAAMQARGDRYALRAFASAGREDVRLTRLKDFDEPLSEITDARLAGLTSGLSTRLGAALRHAGAELAPLRATRKLVLALTDGEPSDIDVANPEELIEDARRAVLGLRARGVDVFGIVMDPEEAGSAETIFGRHNSLPVRRLDELPARLAGVYFRLLQR